MRAFAAGAVTAVGRVGSGWMRRGVGRGGGIRWERVAGVLGAPGQRDSEGTRPEGREEEEA